MKISFIKYKNINNYKFPAIFGIDTEEIKEPEDIDNKIEELKNKKYNTIIIPNELASFSEKIVSEYKNDDKLNIIILSSKNK